MAAKTNSAAFAPHARIFKALAHPGRLLMLDELSRGQRCVCELAALVGSEMPTISRHLSLLKAAGIVEDNKRGNQVFYRLVTPCVTKFVQCLTSLQQKKRPMQAKVLLPPSATGAAIKTRSRLRLITK